MKNYQIILLIFCLIFSINFTVAIEGNVEYNSVYIDYSVLSEQELIKRGDYYKNLAQNPKIKKEQRKAFYQKALGYYVTASQVNEENATLFGIIGYLYGKIDEYTLGKSYLNRGLSLEPWNPIVNFYSGDFYYDYQNYINSLKYYKLAKKNNYYDKYSLNMRLGAVNEKLGDLVKARNAYEDALKLRPKNDELKAKIRSIDDLKYNQTEYYYRKKPFYYDN